MIYLTNDPYPQEISIPRSFGVITPVRTQYLTGDDIATDLETDSDRKVLAASQGVRLKEMVDGKADADAVYTKQQTDDLLAEKANLTDIPDVSQFITRSVNDLANYYLKSETYTQQEVRDLIAAINQFHYEVYASLSDVTDPQSNVLYLIGPTGTGSDRYEEYVFTTEWVKIGDTSIDLSGYVTTQELNTALADYVTNSALDTALAGKADAENVYTKQETDTALDGKADKEGEFPDMLVGTAESLLGTGSQVSEFVFSPMPGVDGIAKLNAARGKSLVWNQMLHPLIGTKTDSGITYTYNRDGSITLNGEVTGSPSNNLLRWSDVYIYENHKYYICADSPKCRIAVTNLGRLYPSVTSDYKIVCLCTMSGRPYFLFGAWNIGDTFNNETFHPFIVDLTLMFGAGNEPSSVAEFEAMFPLPYYDYEPGRIVSNKTEEVEIRDSGNELRETIVLNLPTLTGKLNGEGESVVVFPDGLKSAGSVYDEIVGNKAIKRVGMVDMGTLTWTKTSDGNFYTSIREYYFPTTDVTKVAPLICKRYVTISQTQIDGKDKFIRGNNAQTYIVSLRDLAYTDVATLKASLSGVILYYGLATPVEYILDEPLPGTFRGYKGGTLKQIPENTATPVTAPMVMEATYSADMAAGTADSITAMLNAMKTAGIFSSYTMTYNPATGNYQFTFTR